jgi:hypothetical protein
MTSQLRAPSVCQLHETLRETHVETAPLPDNYKGAINHGGIVLQDWLYGGVGQTLIGLLVISQRSAGTMLVQEGMFTVIATQ